MDLPSFRATLVLDDRPRGLRSSPDLPTCRCRHRLNADDECSEPATSPDSWLCRGCEQNHRPGEPDSLFMVRPL
jgi:hypothetical protein